MKLQKRSNGIYFFVSPSGKRVSLSTRDPAKAQENMIKEGLINPKSVIPAYAGIYLNQPDGLPPARE